MNNKYDATLIIVKEAYKNLFCTTFNNSNTSIIHLGFLLVREGIGYSRVVKGSKAMNFDLRDSDL